LSTSFGNSLEITDELLFKKFHRKDGVESYNQFIVPFRLRKEILKNMHDSIISGHLGKKKTLFHGVQVFSPVLCFLVFTTHTLSTSFGISDWSGCNRFSVKGTGMDIELNMS
jgi:hypothetical protein